MTGRAEGVPPIRPRCKGCGVELRPISFADIEYVRTPKTDAELESERRAAGRRGGVIRASNRTTSVRRIAGGSSAIGRATMGSTPCAAPNGLRSPLTTPDSGSPPPPRPAMREATTLDPAIVTDLALTALGRPRKPETHVACPACDALVHHSDRSQHARECLDLRKLVTPQEDPNG